MLKMIQKNDKTVSLCDGKLFFFEDCVNVGKFVQALLDFSCIYSVSSLREPLSAIVFSRFYYVW